MKQPENLKEGAGEAQTGEFHPRKQNKEETDSEHFLIRQKEDTRSSVRKI